MVSIFKPHTWNGSTFQRLTAKLFRSTSGSSRSATVAIRGIAYRISITEHSGMTRSANPVPFDGLLNITELGPARSNNSVNFTPYAGNGRSAPWTRAY